MSKVTSEMWDEIERQYADGARIAVLAREFNVSRARITRRASRYGWRRQETGDGNATAPGQTQDQPPGSLSGGTPQDQRTLLFERHRAAWAQEYDLRDDAFRVLKGEKTKLLPDIAAEDVQVRVSFAEKLIAMAHQSARALTIAQEGERRAYGFDYKQQQEASVEDEATARRRRELTDSILLMVHRARSEPAENPDGTEPET
jgi:hypothetical protein